MLPSAPQPREGVLAGAGAAGLDGHFPVGWRFAGAEILKMSFVQAILSFFMAISKKVHHGLGTKYIQLYSSSPSFVDTVFVDFFLKIS